MNLDQWVKFTSSLQNRDKLYRFFQYFLRFIAHYFLYRADKQELVKKLQSLSIAIGVARKAWRFGKTVDHLKIIQKTIINDENDIIKWSGIVKSTGYGSWLFLDALQWLHLSKVIDLGKFNQLVNRNAPRLWLLGILGSLIGNLYRINQNWIRMNLSYSNVFTRKEKLGLIDLEMRQTVKDTLQDLVDLVIPLSLMRVMDVSQGTVGLAGSVSSLLALSTLWGKTFK